MPIVLLRKSRILSRSVYIVRVLVRGLRRFPPKTRNMLKPKTVQKLTQPNQVLERKYSEEQEQYRHTRTSINGSQWTKEEAG
jgi:hypothetical protein